MTITAAASRIGKERTSSKRKAEKYKVNEKKINERQAAKAAREMQRNVRGRHRKSKATQEKGKARAK